MTQKMLDTIARIALLDDESLTRIHGVLRAVGDPVMVDIEALADQVDSLSRMIADERFMPVLTADDMNVLEPLMNLLSTIVDYGRENGLHVFLTEDADLFPPRK